MIGLTTSFAIGDSRILRLGSHLNFGNTDIGEHETRNLVLYNDGDSDLTIYDLRFHQKLDGVYSGNFTGIIEAGDSVSITITFAPTQEKDYSGLVYIDSDRTNSNDKSRVLKGIGIDNPANERILTFGTHLNFGDVNVGESETRELLIKNTGNSALTIYGLGFHNKIKDVYSGDFSGEIPVGGSKSVTITFTPKENKEYHGLVYILSNRTNIADEKSRTLIGNGLDIALPTRILTFGEHLDFGNVGIGKTATMMLALHNHGNSPLTISGLEFYSSISDAYHGNFSGIIPAGGSQMVMITFTPTQEKEYKGLLYVNSDKTNDGERSRLLKGVGVDLVPICSSSLANRVLKFGSHLDFGNVQIGNTTSRELILYNKGNCDLNIEKLKFYESIESAYSGNFSGIIEAGHSKSISITFAPLELKGYNGLVYVESNKTNSGDRSRLLTGSGSL